jgi:hypothetical protein
MLTTFHHIQDVIMCQSIVRRKSALMMALLRNHEKNVAAATKIQASWKASVGLKLFAQIKQQIILIQSIHRSGVARQYLNFHKNAATIMSAAWRMSQAIESLYNARNAATTIASAYRARHCVMMYKQTVQCK